MDRIEGGIEILDSLWYTVAIKIVNLAIKVYNLDKEQAKALREVYLRAGDYRTEIC